MFRWMVGIAPVETSIFQINNYFEFSYTYIAIPAFFVDVCVDEYQTLR